MVREEFISILGMRDCISQLRYEVFFIQCGPWSKKQRCSLLRQAVMQSSMAGHTSPMSIAQGRSTILQGPDGLQFQSHTNDWQWPWSLGQAFCLPHRGTLAAPDPQTPGGPNLTWSFPLSRTMGKHFDNF